MSHVTTHVLDASTGRPAAGVPVKLYTGHGSEIGNAVTDADGRASTLGPDALLPGDYRIVFDTQVYFSATSRATFYPRVTIDFTLSDAAANYHVPLLLSPFAYSTYRGS